MRKPVNILSLVAIVVAAVAVWTFTQSRAVSQKFAGASAAGINVLDLTMKGGAVPRRSVAAHWSRRSSIEHRPFEFAQLRRIGDRVDRHDPAVGDRETKHDAQ